MINYNRHPLRVIGLLGVLAPAIVLNVASASADYSGSVKSACKSDFKKYCPSYDINSKALRSCMTAVAFELSTKCVNALERAGEGKRRK